MTEKQKDDNLEINKIVLHDDKIYDFALRVATAMDDLKSSHVYFIVQKAFGEIDWPNVEEILSEIITSCNCKNCKKVKLIIRKNLRG